MTGKASQRKGAGGERELAEILRTYGYSAKRGGSLSFGEVPDLVGLPGIHIECKRVERLNVSEDVYKRQAHPAGSIADRRLCDTAGRYDL